MAALNRTHVAAGFVAGAALLLCSCTGAPTTDPTPAPTTSIEQTAEPSPTAETTASPDTSVFDIDNATEADWAAYADGYEYSDTPQGPAEQWLFDNYPDLWDQGVRAVTYNTWTPSPVRGKSVGTPGALIQYINGERAEGTEALPLRFRGQATDINKFPTDVFPGLMEVLKEPSRWPAGSIGEGGYSVTIEEHYFDTRGEVVNTSMDIYAYEDGAKGIEAGSTDGNGGQRNFDSWEDAWDFLQTQGFQPNSPGVRTLYPGEIASIVVFQENANSRDVVIYNPETGEWETAVSWKHPN